MKLLKNLLSLKRALALILCAITVLITIPSTAQSAKAATGYDRGYPSGMGGDGYIRAHGLDVSAWQDPGLDFKNFANAGYDYVILRCGTTKGKDTCFEEYYTNAKAAGLDVGCYFYSYALTAAEAQQEARNVLEWIKGKVFEYPIYFDFEDPTQMELSGTRSAQICRGFLDVLKDNGYLAGIYSYSWKLSESWVTTSGIRDTYEGWVAHVYSDAANTGITSGEYNIYKDRYASVYGMHQYSFTTYVNGKGSYDADVCYKDYPSLVKKYGFNGYGESYWVEQAAFDSMVYRDRHDDLKDMTDEQLYNHWRNHGIKEGRASSVVLDLKYYVENNADIKAKFGTNYAAAYDYFVKEGYKEKKKFSQVFDGAYYCENHPDVVDVYKENFLLHYVEHGMAEGRRASKTFDVNYYLWARPDVGEVWPGDLTMAAKHFSGHGIKGGEVGADLINPVVSNLAFTNITKNGYTVKCTVTDNWGVEKVSFPTWTEKNNQDDLAANFLNTQLGTKSGNTYTYVVKASDHNYETGVYITHIYAFDKGGNVTVLNPDSVIVKDPSAGKLTLVSSSGYSLSNKMLKKVAESVTVATLMRNFSNTNLKVTNKNGNTLSNNAIVGTGCQIALYENNAVVDVATIIILGDVDGTGVVDATDYLKVKATFMNSSTLTSVEKSAADIDQNSVIDATDYTRIKAHFFGNYNLHK